MIILTIGNSAREAGESFKKYGYHLVSIGNQNNFDIILSKKTSYEDYEQAGADLDDQEIERLINDDEVFLIVSGIEPIAGSVLSFLEKIQEKDISIIYIRPDLFFYSEQIKRAEHAIFQILQQYVRSGLLTQIIIVSEQMLADCIPQGTERSAVFDVLSYSLHMIRELTTAPKIMGVENQRNETQRIRTLGVGDPKTMEVKYFYDLKHKQNSQQFFFLDKSDIKDGQKLIKKINQNQNNISIDYGIYESSHRSYIFFYDATNIIQGDF